LSGGRLRVTVLGSGTSHGVPMIGCRCAVCRSEDPRDNRLRPSIYVETGGGEALVVDTGPDFRAQVLRHGVGRVDAVLFTHPHADHILGLDETRRFNTMQGGVIPCFGNPATILEVRRIFAYAFEPRQPGGGVPQLDLRPVTGPFTAAGAAVVPIPVMHGDLPIYGYRIGGFAYLTDCSAVPDRSWPLLDGVRTLVVDALRHRPHPTHFTVAKAIETARRVGCERTLLTHICHDLGHAETSAALPPGVELAYDGLVVDVA
jgi:phosphoribosyl 1,2-cyclic phosphate phosphodiesterase